MRTPTLDETSRSVIGSTSPAAWRGLLAGGVALGLLGAGCSGDADSAATTTKATTTTTTVATTATTAPPTTAAAPPELPLVPANISPEPATQELPDGTYLAQVNSYNNEDQSLNLNLVNINTDVIGPDGKPYLVEDLDLFTLREIPLAPNAEKLLLPDGGGWVVQPVGEVQEFLSAIGNRPDRPTPFDVNQNSVFAVTVGAGKLTRVEQIYLP